jgi:hypothetical protein
MVQDLSLQLRDGHPPIPQLKNQETGVFLRSYPIFVRRAESQPQHLHNGCISVICPVMRGKSH